MPPKQAKVAERSVGSKTQKSSEVLRSLCLSGGGYRAMLFHTGATIRLNQLGILKKLDALSSVSGGSVLNGILAKHWGSLTWKDDVSEDFEPTILTDVKKIASIDIRTPALVTKRIEPWHWVKLLSSDYSATDLLEGEYDQYLFHEMKLKEIPSSAPRFIFCATNLQTGVCWRFEKDYAGDYQLGWIRNHDLKISEAVAASSAFPLAFPPLVLSFEPKRFQGGKLPDGPEKDAFRKRVLLSDGGVYDNLGLEPVWGNPASTIIVSDGGKPFFINENVKKSIKAEIVDEITGPKTDFLKRLLRCQDIVGNQAEALRKRMLIDDKFKLHHYAGTYFGLKSCYLDFQKGKQPSSLLNPSLEGYSQQVVDQIAEVRTDFDVFSEGEQAVLINHGYTLADAAARTWLPSLVGQKVRALKWPYPDFKEETAALAALK